MDPLVRVLVVDDEAAHVEAIRRSFLGAASPVTVEAVGTLARYREVAGARPPTVAILDLNLPDGRALEALLAPAEAAPFPVLIMTSYGDEQIAVEVMKAGAIDYVVKSAEAFAAMPRTVERALREWKALRERALSDQRYRDLVEGIRDVVLSADTNGRVTYASPSVERTYGFTPAQLVGRHFGDFVLPEDVAMVGEFLARALAGESAPREFRALDAQGRVRHLRLTVAALKDPAGHPTGVTGVLIDLTEQRAAEAERERLQEQLRAAQRLEGIGRLAGGVAHDFNNLLSVILGYGEPALARLHPQDPLREPLEQIRDAAHRAAALTGQLLAFSRKQVLDPRVLDLNEVVRGFEGMLRRLLGEDVLVTTRLSATGCVRADPGQLEQILMNLAVNARDAMPAGGRLLFETADAELDGTFSNRHAGAATGPHVLLAVSDTGTGMDAETRAHAFEPFFTTKERGKGTGLGLATVYGIVKQSGGEILLYSEPGRGTTFKIYLPRVDTPPDRVAPAPPGATAGGTETILLVEDEAALRKVATRILKEAGYEILPAAGWAEALRLAHEHGPRISLLLTDVVMPEVSGAALAEKLMAMLPGLRVLFTSGYTDGAIAQRGDLRPGTRFLAKPFTADGLVARVREALDER